MSSHPHRQYIDPLYGSIDLNEHLNNLAQRPIVQRLRHVRLSNVDSIDMPSIANLSRFEHVLGVAHLSTLLALRPALNHDERLLLDASALLHDWAITSFGHLTEEALQYVGTKFSHEERLREILLNSDEELLGADLQIILGRGPGLREWASVYSGRNVESTLRAIMDTIQGGGPLGRIISGDIDIDNIDNVYRMAYHMGLRVDFAVPERLARSLVGVTDSSRQPIFRKEARQFIISWQEARRSVYENLMLAERDFVGKLMLLYATVRAFEAGEIRVDDWRMFDQQFIARLLDSSTKEVREAAERWMVGELWTSTPLIWFKGKRPAYPKLLELSLHLSSTLDRTCFAYGIQDKRERAVAAHFDSGEAETFGKGSNQWLLGVGSPLKRPFTHRELKLLIENVTSRLGTEVIHDQTATSSNGQAWLL
ncbi:HD domain-containing protein [Bradyrhizobium commune]|uniref:HD domain-containing protein n=1 Tax=Bradyrhizobium commune TaxID=83627 RepID=A0A7S9D7A8_9BRAD|nr:HD domain-containing protein [Bradyrhizobium commune]QPF92313.1 HD domain-containing protein [Bradyrhizobium commune]